MDGHSMVRALRQRGLTQKQISDELGCAQSSVHAWETDARGGVRGISGNYLLKLIQLYERTSMQPKADAATGSARAA